MVRGLCGGAWLACGAGGGEGSGSLLDATRRPENGTGGPVAVTTWPDVAFVALVFGLIAFVVWWIGK